MDDLVLMSPVRVGMTGDTAARYLVGYFRGEPVYRTCAHILATDKHACVSPLHSNFEHD